MFSKLREPVSGLTHLLGAFLSLAGMIYFIQCSIINGKNKDYIYIFIIFGISLILLYSASSIYHLVCAPAKVIMFLRRIDHSMIYVLIAGTYTPICLVALKGTVGIKLLITVWCFAIVGILLKIFWFDAPRWLYTLFYIIMGWLAIFVIVPLSHVIPAVGMYLLVAGGIFYTIGGIIYGTKWPKITNKYFGFHEIFHIFVLLGSLCHFILMFKYVL